MLCVIGKSISRIGKISFIRFLLGKILGNISFEYDDGCDSCVTDETNDYDEDDDSIYSEFYSIR